MPTTRSLYSFKQFEKVFQKLAYEIAVLAVIDLEDGLLINGYRKGELQEVLAGPYHIKFYAEHLNYSQGKYDDSDHLDFDIEEKFYSTSAHCTKISFYSPEIKNEDIKDDFGFAYLVDHKKTDAEKQRRQNKIDKFLEQLMKEAGLKPEPRFSLNKYSKHEEKPGTGVSLDSAILKP